MDMYCPQCGEETDDLKEGYCLECCEENHNSLFRHNFEYNEWNKLSDSEKQNRINERIK